MCFAMSGDRRKSIPVAMTIAGSDSSGGAGIEADLKTFASLGVHGTVAITSITAQNTYSVKAVYDLPPDIVYKQVEAVYEDTGIDAAKTGMLSNSGIIEAVSRAVKSFGFPIVVDPVMIAKSGAKLLRDDAIDTLIKVLLPLATVVTPNRMEAERITGIEIKSIDDAKRAAKMIVEDIGSRAAVVKGGHMDGDDAIDILYVDGRYREFRAPRISDGCTHGTGCSFSAAIAAEIAKGMSIEEAVDIAKKFISIAIAYGLRIGRGHCPVNPVAWLEIPAGKYMVLEDMYRAIDIIERNGELFSRYIPEVQTNIAMAISSRYARDINDVAAVKGRIVRYGNTVKAVGPVEFGASRHVARAVLTAMSIDPGIRAAMVLKYDERIIEAARELGYTVAFVDRRGEPQEIRGIEGASIPWIVKKASEALGRVPDIVYDHGDMGREPVVRVFGSSATEVVMKVMKILKKAENI